MICSTWTLACFGAIFVAFFFASIAWYVGHWLMGKALK
jgi:hypothetical protein